MQDKKRILFVTQEMKPYTTLSQISELLRDLPPYTQKQGYEVRILMPRFGSINERRHRLHEVVRLSGMNIIVDDDDYPLIIKVASLPGARLQVYFLDNEEFFKRKAIFTNKKGEPFEDNEERMIFFCEGVVETVKKFGWPPDVIHCHGWMTSLLPMYIREAYNNEPIVEDSSIVYSLYDQDFPGEISDDFFEKAIINDLEEEDFDKFRDDNEINLHKGAIAYSDAVVIGSGDLSEEKRELLIGYTNPVVEYTPEDEATLDSYKGLYAALTKEEEEVGDEQV